MMPSSSSRRLATDYCLSAACDVSAKWTRYLRVASEKSDFVLDHPGQVVILHVNDVLDGRSSFAGRSRWR